MNTKVRITKLESVGRDLQTDYMLFVHEVRRGGDVFFKGALKVDEDTYIKELAEYTRLHKDSKIHEMIIHCGGAE